MVAKAKKQQDAAPPSPAVIVLVSLVLTAALAWAGYPVFVPVWVGALAVVWTAVHPVLTGEKVNGFETPAHDGEKRQLAEFQLAKKLRMALLVPFEAVTGSGLAAAAFLLGAGLGVLVPSSGVGLELPGGYLLPAVSPEWVVPLKVVNAWAGGVLALFPISWGVVQRKRPGEEAPVAGVRDVAAWCGRGGAFGVGLVVLVAALVAAGVAAVTVLVSMLPVTAWWFPTPMVTGATVGFLVAVWTVGELVVRARRDGWFRDREADDRWQEIFRDKQLKLTSAPRLVSHRVLDEYQLTIDEFDSGGAVDIGQLVKSRPVIARLLGDGMSVACVLNSPEVDDQGEIKRGTRSGRKFRIVTAPDGAPLPDLSDARVSSDVAEVALECMLAMTSEQLKQHVLPLVLSFGEATNPSAGDEPHAVKRDPLMVEDAPAPAEELSWTQAWQASVFDESQAGIVEQLQPLAKHYGFGDIEFAVFGRDVFFGAVTAPSTPLKDPELPKKIADQELIQDWKRRWRDTVTQVGIVAGAIPHDAEVSLIKHLDVLDLESNRSSTVTVTPFQMMRGVNLDQFISSRVERTLSTAFDGAGFVHCMYWQHRASREGERMTNVLAVAISREPQPTSPKSLYENCSRDASQRREVARTLLSKGVADAFEQAKLPRPELVEARCMSGPRTASNIWAMKLRLIGSDLEKVRQKMATIREALGVPWAVVTTTSPDGGKLSSGVWLVAGGHPRDILVEFSDDARGEKNRAYCESVLWESQFTALKVFGADGGTPMLVETGQMGSNPDITVSTFELPPPVTCGVLREQVEKLRGATGNAFVMVEPDMSSPSRARILTAEKDPLPSLTYFDFGAYRPGTEVPFAQTVDGSTVTFDTKHDPHLLVLGPSGSGKSATLMALINGMFGAGFDLVLLDPSKGGADFQYAKPWFTAMTGDVHEASALMDWAYGEVKRRKDMNAAHGASSIKELPEEIRPRPLAVVIDEFTSLMLADPVPKTDGSETPEMLRDIEEKRLESVAKRNIGLKVGRIAREARSAGVVLVLATQELKKDTLDRIPGGGDLKTQLARLVLGKNSFGSLMSALKAPTEAPDLGLSAGMKGRGIFESARPGPMQIVQCWWGVEGGASEVVVKDTLRRQLEGSREPVAEPLDLAGMAQKTQKPEAVFGEVIEAPAGDEPVVEVEFEGPEFSFDEDGDDPFGFGDDESVPAPVAVSPGVVSPSVEATSIPRLYLDVDRVVAPVGMPADWEDAEPVQAPVGTAWFSPTMLQRLTEHPVDLVWVTSWGEQAMETFAPFLGGGVRQVRCCDPGRESDGWWKADAVAQDLAEHPTMGPVAWLDDHHTKFEADGDAAIAGVHALKIAPDDGLTPAEADRVRAWFGVDAPEPSPAMVETTPTAVADEVPVSDSVPAGLPPEVAALFAPPKIPTVEIPDGFFD